jgi:hypothetical protein
MPIITATEKVEIRRIEVKVSSGKKVSKTLSQ